MLEVQHISCKYSSEVAVDDISFRVKQGERLCLLGPSGCGKTTILKAIAGFHVPACGNIYIDGTTVCSTETFVPTQSRRIGMVFQDHALFPHLSARENVGAGLWREVKNKKDMVVSDLMDILGIGNLGDRYPHELSGGQQQRVALARALAPKPLLLLMDEPFSNLDLELRLRLSQEVSELLKAYSITSVIVTHDQQDAFLLGDKVGVIAAGRLLQLDTPHNVYHQPSSRVVASFIGDGVFIPGFVNQDNNIETKHAILQPSCKNDLNFKDKVDVLLRPEDVIFDPSSRTRAAIIKRLYKGPQIIYTLLLSDKTKVLASFSSHSYFEIGQEIGIRLELDHVVAFKNTFPN